jgi:hypothetical protein
MSKSESCKFISCHRQRYRLLLTICAEYRQELSPLPEAPYQKLKTAFLEHESGGLLCHTSVYQVFFMISFTKHAYFMTKINSPWHDAEALSGLPDHRTLQPGQFEHDIVPRYVLTLKTHFICHRVTFLRPLVFS